MTSDKKFKNTRVDTFPVINSALRMVHEMRDMESGENKIRSSNEKGEKTNYSPEGKLAFFNPFFEKKLFYKNNFH